MPTFKRRYLDLVNSLDGVVWEAEVGEKGYTFISQSAEALFGYPLGHWYKEEGFWQSIVHPEDLAKFEKAGRLRADDKEDNQAEYRVRRADGTYIWIKDFIRVMPGGWARKEKLRGIMVDITERKLVEERLRESQQEAMALAQTKGEFLANMSHEMRTPLNAIIGMTELLTDLPKSPEVQEYVKTIKASADSLLSVINDVLDFSKIDAGKLELEVVDFNLSALVTNAIDLTSVMADAKGIALSAHVEKGVPADVRGDPGRILQILLNLLSNAIKFTHEGRVDVRVLPAAAGGTGDFKVRFEVTDTGIGLDKEEKARLFQPFCQADSSTSRKYRGTGLGLSICRRLVDLMKGEISVESIKGRGSCFHFEIPLANALAPVVPVTEAGTGESPRLLDLSKKKILVVEDNLANQKVMKKYLEKLQCRAEFASNGEEALAACQRTRFDLIFMDCQMPEMDGYQATEYIRRLEKSKDRKPVPIVALTAHVLSGDREKCIKAGMDDYLPKPVTLRMLRGAFEKWFFGVETKECPKSETPKGPDLTKVLDETPRIDESYLAELRRLDNGRNELVNELKQVFFNEGTKKLAILRQAFENRDFRLMMRTAHTMKSTSNSIGARKAARIFQTIEEDIRTNEKPGPDIAQLMELAENEFQTTSTELSRGVA